MSPEVIQSQGQSNYNEKADIWSIGVVAFSLLTSGIYPFPGKTKNDLDRKILDDEPEYGDQDCFSQFPKAKNFID